MCWRWMPSQVMRDVYSIQENVLMIAFGSSRQDGRCKDRAMARDVV